MCLFSGIFNQTRQIVALTSTTEAQSRQSRARGILRMLWASRLYLVTTVRSANERCRIIRSPDLDVTQTARFIDRWISPSASRAWLDAPRLGARFWCKWYFWKLYKAMFSSLKRKNIYITKCTRLFSSCLNEFSKLLSSEFGNSVLQSFYFVTVFTKTVLPGRKLYWAKWEAFFWLVDTFQPDPSSYERTRSDQRGGGSGIFTAVSARSSNRRKLGPVVTFHDNNLHKYCCRSFYLVSTFRAFNYLHSGTFVFTVV